MVFVNVRAGTARRFWVPARTSANPIARSVLEYPFVLPVAQVRREIEALGEADAIAPAELLIAKRPFSSRDLLDTMKLVLRLFPPCALVSHAQGSSGVVGNMPFARRGHTKSLTSRARPGPDLAMWLE